MSWRRSRSPTSSARGATSRCRGWIAERRGSARLASSRDCPDPWPGGGPAQRARSPAFGQPPQDGCCQACCPGGRGPLPEADGQAVPHPDHGGHPTPTSAGPSTSHDLPMPAQQRGRCHQERRPALPWQHPGRRGQDQGRSTPRSCGTRSVPPNCHAGRGCITEAIGSSHILEPRRSNQEDAMGSSPLPRCTPAARGLEVSSLMASLKKPEGVRAYVSCSFAAGPNS